MSRLRSHRGFTLLETILAVGLSALLIGLMGAGIRIYTRTVAERRADVVNAQIARVILQRIANDLSAAYVADESSGGSSSTDSAAEGEETSEGSDSSVSDATSEDTAAMDLSTGNVQPTPGLFGNQSQLQIDVWGKFTEPIKFDTLTAAGIDPKAANLLSDPKVITYFLRPLDAAELAGTPLQSMGTAGQQTVLIRRIVSRAEATYAALYGGIVDQSSEQLLSDQVVVLQFMYHDGFDWVDSWDSSLLGGLPTAVNISLAIVDANTANITDLSSLTTDNFFQQTVYLPTAVIPDTTTGI